MVFQSYALYPHMTVRENMGFSLRLRNDSQERIAERVAHAARILNLGHLSGPLPERAVGRPAPARRDGPGDRARPEGVPVRRAALQPGRQAARGDARRDQGAAPAPEDHHRLRHARPGRGDDHGRPHRGDERGPDRAARRAARAVRPAGEPVRRAVHRLAGDERVRRGFQGWRGRCARARVAVASVRRQRTARRSNTASAPSTSTSARAASLPRSWWSSRWAPRPSWCCRSAARRSRSMTHGRAAYGPGDKIHVSPQPEHAHLFDAASGT